MSRSPRMTQEQFDALRRPQRCANCVRLEQRVRELERTAPPPFESAVCNPQTLTIADKVPSLNDVIAKAKRHPRAYSNFKAKWRKIVVIACADQSIQPVKGKALVSIVAREATRRRDADNVLAVAMKVVLDGLQHAGVIAGDDASNVKLAGLRVEHPPKGIKRADRERDWQHSIIVTISEPVFKEADSDKG